MAATRSFKEYISGRFYNELSSAVSEYLEANFRSMEFPDDIVRYVYSAELSDITVKVVYVDDLPGMKINFDVLVDAEIDFAEKNYRDDRFHNSM